MGMKPYSYVVAGIKTTTQQCKANGIDIWSGDFDEGVNEHDIRVVTGEGTDDVLIGKVLFETDPYGDTDSATMLVVPDMDELLVQIRASGVDTATMSQVELYAITVWL
jgi:hypothetical protein